MKNFSIRLPEEQREAISKIASENSLKESDVMRAAVRHYLKSLKRRKGAK